MKRLLVLVVGTLSLTGVGTGLGLVATAPAGAATATVTCDPTTIQIGSGTAGEAHCNLSGFAPNETVVATKAPTPFSGFVPFMVDANGSATDVTVFSDLYRPGRSRNSHLHRSNEWQYRHLQLHLHAARSEYMLNPHTDDHTTRDTDHDTDPYAHEGTDDSGSCTCGSTGHGSA